MNITNITIDNESPPAKVELEMTDSNTGECLVSWDISFRGREINIDGLKLERKKDGSLYVMDEKVW